MDKIKKKTYFYLYFLYATKLADKIFITSSYVELNFNQTSDILKKKKRRGVMLVFKLFFDIS